jgi:hypothetical protein
MSCAELVAIFARIDNDPGGVEGSVLLEDPQATTALRGGKGRWKSGFKSSIALHANGS